MTGRPSAARLVRWCIVTAATLMAIAALGPGLALAVRGHVFAREFGSPGSGPGQLKEPDGVAVNEATEVVYVAEKGNNRVQMFDPNNGQTVGEFNGSGKLKNVKGEEFEGKPAGGGGQPGEEPTGEFSGPTLIAVDNSCEQHKPKLTKTSTPKTCEEEYPSNGDVYVIDAGHKVVDKYTATGEYVGQINQKTLGIELRPVQATGEGLLGVSVEADGDVLVSVNLPEAEAAKEGVYRVSNAERNDVLPSPGDPTGSTGTHGKGFVDPGLGVAGGRVFVNEGANSVTVWGLEGSLLAGGFIEENGKGRFVPPLYGSPVGDGIGGLAGEACTGDAYVDTGTAIERFEGTHLEGSGGPVESLPVPGGITVEDYRPEGYGVAPDCASEGLFAANLGAGKIDVYEKTPPQPPEVEPGGGFASEVSDDGAKLSASVNPRSNPGEDATIYVFEYGPCPLEGACGGGYPRRVTGSVPASYEPASVSATVRGLSADTRYYYRVSARNGKNLESSGKPASVGEELSFVTQSVFPGGLLDGRGWELVSPPDKFGAELEPVKETGVIQASGDGGALTFLASAPTEAHPAGNTNSTQVLARRGETGWSSCDVGLPNERATGASVGVGEEYLAFSPDLQAGLARPFGPVVPGLAPGAREVSPLLADLSGSCAAKPAYRALLSGCPAEGEACEPVVKAHEDVEPGVEVAEEPYLCIEQGAAFCDAEPQGANESLSAVVVMSRPPLGKELPREALYEWAGGHVYPVSVQPSGQVVGGGALGSQQYYGSSLRGAISADGARVVWSERSGLEHLYVWDRASGKSVQVDTVQHETGVTGGEGLVQPVLQFMTADGSKVFFTDTERLTANAGEKGVPDLYECEVVVEGEGEESKPACVLRDLTPRTEAGESADMIGEAIGYSGDASTIYFVADGVLSSNTDPSGQRAVKGTCTGAPSREAECNLYEWHEGTVELVAVISGEDVGDWGAEHSEQGRITGRVSGDRGEWLAFMSDRSLTGYDNRDLHSGDLDEEVYLYDSVDKSLVCVSCNPTGERPNGVEYGSNHSTRTLDEGLAGGVKVWPKLTWLAASVPAWMPMRLGEGQYQPRYLDGSGRMFFDSSDGLVPRDTNGTEDVYEYEPANVGTCWEGGPGYVAQDQGCLGLVSSGESSEESGFLDASENGNDVFFITSSKLSKRDTDTSLDIYDARVGGTEPEESKPVECQGDACQSPVTPPESLTPSSLTFSGPGNMLTPPAPGSGKPKPKPETGQQKLQKALKVCRKDRGRTKRKTCEKKARAVFGARTHKAKRRG